MERRKAVPALLVSVFVVVAVCLCVIESGPRSIGNWKFARDGEVTTTDLLPTLPPTLAPRLAKGHCLDCKKNQTTGEQTHGDCQHPDNFDCVDPLPGTWICPTNYSVCNVWGCKTNAPGKPCSNHGFCDQDGDCKCHSPYFGVKCDGTVLKSGMTVSFRDTRTRGYLETGPTGWLYLRPRLLPHVKVPDTALFRVYANDLGMDCIKFGQDVLLQSVVSGFFFRQQDSRYITCAIAGMPGEYDPNAIFNIHAAETDPGIGSEYGIANMQRVSITMYDGPLAGRGPGGLVIADQPDAPFVMDIHDAHQVNLVPPPTLPGP